MEIVLDGLIVVIGKYIHIASPLLLRSRGVAEVHLLSRVADDCGKIVQVSSEILTAIESSSDVGFHLQKAQVHKLFDLIQVFKSCSIL